MVKILEEFPLISTGRPSKYNWEEWLEGPQYNSAV